MSGPGSPVVCNGIIQEETQSQPKSHNGHPSSFSQYPQDGTTEWVAFPSSDDVTNYNQVAPSSEAGYNMPVVSAEGSEEANQEICPKLDADLQTAVPSLPTVSNSEMAGDESNNFTDTISSDVDSLLNTDYTTVSIRRSTSKESIASSNVSFSLWATSRRQKLVLLSLAIVDFTSTMCLSVLAPFFPGEATKRGVSTSVSGWIFGIFALTQFITSPLFGKLLVKAGSRFTFITGQFLAGSVTILYGFLDYMPFETDTDLTIYISYCFVLRIILALGCTAANTASFAITADTFPDNIGAVFGILETFTGLGLMLGPALGGALYEVGGFVAPFVAIGAIMVAFVPINLCVLPSSDDEVTERRSNINHFKELLCVPSVVITCVAVVIAALAFAILDPTLEPHLSEFNLGPSMVGLIFLLMSAFYAVSAPVWGWVADKIRDSSILLVFGFLVTTVGLLLLGPSPLLGFAPNYNELWLNLVALVLLGLSVSLAMIPTFEKIMDAAYLAGIEDCTELYSAVAGFWGSANALGEFLGPVAGGILVQTSGFAWTMTYTAGCFLLMAIVLFILWLYEKKYGPTGVRKSDEVLQPNLESRDSMSEEEIDDDRAAIIENMVSGYYRSSPSLLPRSQSEVQALRHAARHTPRRPSSQQSIRRLYSQPSSRHSSGHFNSRVFSGRPRSSSRGIPSAPPTPQLSVQVEHHPYSLPDMNIIPPELQSAVAYTYLASRGPPATSRVTQISSHQLPRQTSDPNI